MTDGAVRGSTPVLEPEPDTPTGSDNSPRPWHRSTRARLGIAILAVLTVGGAAWVMVRPRTASGPAVTVTDAVMGANDDDVVAVYLVIRNDGPEDRLVDVTSPDAERVSLHLTETRNGLSIMQTTDAVDVPAGGEVRFDPGASHLMAEHTHAPATVGSVIRLSLHFERSGTREIQAVAVPLAELPDRLPN